MTLDDRPPVECARCAVEIHWLAVFPGTICVDCHAESQVGRDPAEMWAEMIEIFSGRGPR